jgi:hypothetical protein
MARRFNADRVARLLAPSGFVLNLPEVMKGGVSFVRPSLFPRLYEHVLFVTSNVVYAETVLSAATFTSCHRCVSEPDKRFSAFLSKGDLFGASDLGTAEMQRLWQQRLVENADAFCRTMAAEKGPALVERLRPVFAAVDSYVAAMEDMAAIFDREFAFVNNRPAHERAEIERLASETRAFFYLDLEDARLASCIVLRLAPQVEGKEDPFLGVNARQDEGLAARLVMLSDFIRIKRTSFIASS